MAELAQKKLEARPQRDQILSSVAFAASAFLKSANWKDALDEVLRRLGEAAEANRAYYFENRCNDDGEIFTSQVAEWVAGQILPQIDNPDLQDISFVDAGMERWLELMNNRQPVHGVVADFPQSERDVLEPQGIRSLVVMPVFSDNAFVGFLGFDDCESMRKWTTTEFDALGAAAAALGAAIDRQRLENQLRIAQKMEAVGRLASGVAHDFNNMLQAIVGLTNVAKLKAEESLPLTEELDGILSASDRATSLTSQLLVFSRKQEIRQEITDLGLVCNSVVTMVKPTLGADIELCVDVSDPAPMVLADSGLLCQVLLNLCFNARDAMPGGGVLGLSCQKINLNEAPIGFKEIAEPGDYACLTVSDTGCGMTPEIQERIFEPFYTTKASCGGTGLGLSVAYSTIRQCGGFIDVSSTPAVGSTFRIVVPLAEGANSAAGLEPIIREGANETILLVDDEPTVLNCLRIVLEMAGYCVLTATNGQAGIRVFEENRDAIELVVSDLVMPEVDGLELLHQIESIAPDIKSILLSGFAGDIPESRKESSKTLVLQKPIQRRDLNKSIRQLLGPPVELTDRKQSVNS